VIDPDNDVDEDESATSADADTDDDCDGSVNDAGTDVDIANVTDAANDVMLRKRILLKML
jgi:hypothetical protein